VPVPSQESERGIDLAAFYNFSIGFWNCTYSVVFLVLQFVPINVPGSLDHGIVIFN
jgi:hypothetical protein